MVGPSALAIDLVNSSGLATAAVAAWRGGDGSWSMGDLWSTGTAPGGSHGLSDARIDTLPNVMSHVVLDRSVRLSSLHIADGDSLAVLDGFDLSFLAGGGLLCDGALALSAGTPQLTLDAASAVQWGGDGVLTLGGPGSRIAAGASPQTLFTDLAIEGEGTIDLRNLDFINGGAVTATRPYRALIFEGSGASFTNHGALRSVSNASLRLRDVSVQNTLGEIVADGGRVELQNATIQGGVLRAVQGGEIRTSSADATFTNLTLEGVYEITGGTLTIAGRFVNRGEVYITGSEEPERGGEAAPAFIVFDGSAGPVIIEGNGTLTLEQANAANVVPQDPMLLVNQAGHTIHASGQFGQDSLGLVNHGRLVAAGIQPLVVDARDDFVIVNTGTMRAQSPGGIVLLDSKLDNEGAVEVASGSRFLILPGSTVENVAGVVLNGGRWVIDGRTGAATLSIDSAPALLINHADVVLRGPHASFPKFSQVQYNSGTLEIADAATYASTFAFTNTGALHVGTQSTFRTTAAFTQSTTGALHIALGAQPNLSGKVEVVGVAALNGALVIDAAQAADWPVGASVDVLTAALVTGQLTSVDVPSNVSVQVMSNRVRVTVQEPACSADLDGNGVVNSLDLRVLMRAWGACPIGAACPADLNRDGAVNSLDLALLLGVWGGC